MAQSDGEVKEVETKRGADTGNASGSTNITEIKRATQKEWPFAKFEKLFDRYDLTESARILN